MKKAGILILLALVLFGCETSSEDCATPATVRNLTGLDGCGWVFELENGTRLDPAWSIGFCGTPPLPKEVTEDPLYNFEYAEGKKVFISYEILQDVVTTCMVGPSVKITCIKEINSISAE